MPWDIMVERYSHETVLTLCSTSVTGVGGHRLRGGAHDQPDAGLWELRGSARVHTFSAVMCWVACDRLARIARQLGLAERAAYWQEQSQQQIHATISQRAWNKERNAFVATFDGNAMDARLLLLAEVGFIDAADPRFASTVAAVEKD